MIPERQFTALAFIARHYVCTASQLKAGLFEPGQDKDGRLTRRILGSLLQLQFIHRCRCELVNPLYGTTAPLYYPAKAGVEALALKTGDTRWLLKPTERPVQQNLLHWLALTDLRAVSDKALPAQGLVTMPEFFNEFDTVHAEATDPESRYKLYTVVATMPKKIVCVPDAAFSLQIGSFKKCFYVELERGTTDPWKASALKSPGYAGMATHQLHRRHFPDAMAEWNVLMFAPSVSWRQSLQKAMNKKEGAHLWKFAALPEVTPETFLYGEVFYNCEGKASSLVKRPEK